MRKRELKGKVALVTGANSGIGEAIALGLGDKGASVGVNYVKEGQKAGRIVKRIEKHGGRAISLYGDIGKEEDVMAMFGGLLKRFGKIDILVNNAGIQQDADFVNMSVAQWQRVIDVNLTGSFLCAREAARNFLRKKKVQAGAGVIGKIIFMSSVHEVIPWARHANYASSKGAISMLAKTIAQELAPFKIRVNSVAPGAIKTPINKAAWTSKSKRKKLLELIPYGRIGKPEDVACCVAWLASDDSDYVNGATIYVDGGMSLYPGFSTGG